MQNIKKEKATYFRKLLGKCNKYKKWEKTDSVKQYLKENSKQNTNRSQTKRLNNISAKETVANTKKQTKDKIKIRRKHE